MPRSDKEHKGSAQHTRTKQIRVLQITQALGGGVQKYVIQLCQHLNAKQFNVTGCCSVEAEHDFGEGDIPFSAAFRNLGIPYFVVAMQRTINLRHDCGAFIKIYRALRQNRFDIVHAHSSKAGVLARIAARMAGVPVVIYSPHAFSFDGPGHWVRKLTYSVFEKIATWFCDAVITDSPSEKALAMRKRVAQDGKIAVVPPGIELRDYNPKMQEGERRACLDKVGLPGGQKVVTMIGRLAPQKDPVTFIRSCEAIHRERPQVSYLLVGDGPLMDQCLQLIKSLGLNEKIAVLGWRRDYQMLLKLSDVLVLTSLWEGLPFVLLEAMALSKPVVGTRTTGTVDVIKNGQNGFLVTPQSPDLLAGKVMWILDNPEAASEMGQAARRTVEEQFTLVKTIPSIEEIYLDLYEKKVTKKYGQKI